MPNDQEEIARLAAQIRTSPAFAGAPDRKALFDYLFKRRTAYTPGRTLAQEHFKIGPAKFDLEAGRVRAQCNDLRDALEKYPDAPDATWRCVFPQGIRDQGYRLEFKRIRREDTPARLFWAPHLAEPQRVIVVTNSHLFFFDSERGMMFRFGDLNVEGDDDEALAALKQTHPEAYHEGLSRHHFYLSAGEVTAFEMFQRWFHERTNVLITRHVSRDVLDRQIHDASPILMGRPGANKFIRRILESSAAAHLGYRFRPPLGAVHINKITKHESQVLSRFPVSNEGLLGPVPRFQVIFGIVTRLPHPSGQGSVTVISADYYPKAIAQLMALLIDGQRTARLIERMGWPADGPLPSSFEMLFSVRLSPGDLEGEGHAEFLCGRTY